MTAKLVSTLETAMHKAMQEKQYSAVASNAKVLMKLIGMEPRGFEPLTPCMPCRCSTS